MYDVMHKVLYCCAVNFSCYYSYYSATVVNLLITFYRCNLKVLRLASNHVTNAAKQLKKGASKNKNKQLAEGEEGGKNLHNNKKLYY